MAAQTPAGLECGEHVGVGLAVGEIRRRGGERPDPREPHSLGHAGAAFGLGNHEGRHEGVGDDGVRLVAELDLERIYAGLTHVETVGFLGGALESDGERSRAVVVDRDVLEGHAEEAENVVAQRPVHERSVEGGTSSSTEKRMVK